MDPAQQFHLENHPDLREPPLEPTRLTVACSMCGMTVWAAATGPCPRCGGRLEEVQVLGTTTLVAVHKRGEVIIDRRSGLGLGLPPW